MRQAAERVDAAAPIRTVRRGERGSQQRNQHRPEDPRRAASAIASRRRIGRQSQRCREIAAARSAPIAAPIAPRPSSAARATSGSTSAAAVHCSSSIDGGAAAARSARRRRAAPAGRIARLERAPQRLAGREAPTPPERPHRRVGEHRVRIVHAGGASSGPPTSMPPDRAERLDRRDAHVRRRVGGRECARARARARDRPRRPRLVAET